MKERRNPEEAERLFEKVVARFSADPAVAAPSVGKGGRFGASALKVNGKIFAMLSGAELVVKLPRQRVDELVASAKGKRFDPGHGRVMKEWVTIARDHTRDWPNLAEEARRFVAEAKP